MRGSGEVALSCCRAVVAAGEEGRVEKREEADEVQESEREMMEPSQL